MDISFACTLGTAKSRLHLWKYEADLGSGQFACLIVPKLRSRDTVSLRTLNITQENSVLHEKWVEQYGPTITYDVFFGVSFHLEFVGLQAH